VYRVFTQVTVRELRTQVSCDAGCTIIAITTSPNTPSVRAAACPTGFFGRCSDQLDRHVRCPGNIAQRQRVVLRAPPGAPVARAPFRPPSCRRPCRHGGARTATTGRRGTHPLILPDTASKCRLSCWTRILNRPDVAEFDTGRSGRSQTAK
jgi:hypothetical protein